MIKIDEVIAIQPTQKIGEDGKALGYSWHCNTRYGLVVSITEKTVSFKNTEGEVETLPFEDENYTYSFVEASESAYRIGINKEIQKRERAVQEAKENLQELTLFVKEFDEFISLKGRLLRFIKSSM